MAAPDAVLPSKVNVALVPFQDGSVALTDANASTRPAPSALFAASAGVALEISRLRTVARAVSGATVDDARPSRQGAFWSSSAAMPPRCGEAADVPKNWVPKLPAPVMETPSIAASSGLARP